MDTILELYFGHWQDPDRRVILCGRSFCDACERYFGFRPFSVDRVRLQVSRAPFSGSKRIFLCGYHGVELPDQHYTTLFGQTSETARTIAGGVDYWKRSRPSRPKLYIKLSLVTANNRTK